MQKSLRCKDSRLGFGILILFGISLVIPKFRITRRSVLQDPEKDSEIHAALSSLNWPDWLKPGSLRICFLRTWWVSSIMTTAGRLRQSSTRWTDWGMVWNGNVLTAKISASPSQERTPACACALPYGRVRQHFLAERHLFVCPCHHAFSCNFLFDYRAEHGTVKGYVQG